MAPFRKIVTALKDSYPDVYNSITESFNEIARPFDDIYLLSRILNVTGYDNRLIFMGCIVLMYTESELLKGHCLKDGTILNVSRALSLKDSNVSNYLSSARAIMKYQKDVESTCRLMVQILDNYKSQLNHD